MSFLGVKTDRFQIISGQKSGQNLRRKNYAAYLQQDALRPESTVIYCGQKYGH